MIKFFLIFAAVAIIAALAVSFFNPNFRPDLILKRLLERVFPTSLNESGIKQSNSRVQASIKTGPVAWPPAEEPKKEDNTSEPSRTTVYKVVSPFDQPSSTPPSVPKEPKKEEEEIWVDLDNL